MRGIDASRLPASVVLMPRHPYEISSSIRQCDRHDSPRPPADSGISLFIRPVSQAFSQISLGKVPVSSRCPATGMISFFVNSRAVWISACCSSLYSKLAMVRSFLEMGAEGKGNAAT